MDFLREKYAQSFKTEDVQASELEEEDTNGLLSNSRKASTSKYWNHTGLYLILCGLCLLVIIQGVFLLRKHDAKTFLSPNGLSRERSEERTTFLPSVYISENETEADLAWDYISPGYGIVAVTPEYAKKLNLPDSLPWRGDRSKRVYVVEAYHAIHCIRIVRQHYLALLHGTKWDWPLKHDMHCLDGLRQYVMCNPDDTLLWSTGHRDAGHGQMKKCQNWDALRDWTAQHTISYFDYEHGHRDKTIQDFHGGDGLPMGSFF